MTEKLANEIQAPDRIFLQVCEDDLGALGTEVTWCADRINDTDVEYVRSPEPETAQSGEQELRRAASALVAKLQQIHEDPSYQNVWITAQIHGAPYAGPKYLHELDELRAALTLGSVPPQPDDGPQGLVPREHLYIDLLAWTLLPRETLDRLPYRVIDLMHTAAYSARCDLLEPSGVPPQPEKAQAMDDTAIASKCREIFFSNRGLTSSGLVYELRKALAGVPPEVPPSEDTKRMLAACKAAFDYLVIPRHGFSDRTAREKEVLTTLRAAIDAAIGGAPASEPRMMVSRRGELHTECPDCRGECIPAPASEEASKKWDDFDNILSKPGRTNDEG